MQLTIVLHGILDIDDHHITPCRSYERPRVLAVDEQTCPRPMSIWVTGSVRNFKIVCHCVASRRELLIEVGGNAVTVGPA